MIGISAADLVRQFRLRFGVRGATNLSLDENILPVTNVADLEQAPWNSKQGGVSSKTEAAVAASFAYHWLALPFTTPPGVALVPRYIWLQPTVAMQVKLHAVTTNYANNTLGGGGANAFTWDTFDSPQVGATPGISAGRTLTQAQHISTTNAADLLTAGTGFEVQAPATGIMLTLPFCIRAQNALLVQGKTVNVGLTVAFFWDEYLAE